MGKVKTEKKEEKQTRGLQFFRADTFWVDQNNPWFGVHRMVFPSDVRFGFLVRPLDESRIQDLQREFTETDKLGNESRDDVGLHKAAFMEIVEDWRGIEEPSGNGAGNRVFPCTEANKAELCEKFYPLAQTVVVASNYIKTRAMAGHEVELGNSASGGNGS